jgi:antitoxin component YwqK of YwqJK toxin-antitoxin module
MKRTVTQNLIFFLLSLVLFSCEKNLICGKDQEYLKLEKGILYYKGSPFSGKITCYQFIKPRMEVTGISPTGVVTEQTVGDGMTVGSIERYEEGKKDGEWLSFHENGEVSERKLYEEGTLEGLYESFHPNGESNLRGFYKGGEKEGEWIQLWENGTFFVKENYLNGNLNGKYESFEKNGDVRVVGFYKEGEKEGVWEYYPSTDLSYSEEFQNGNRIR